MDERGNTPPCIHADGALLGGLWGDMVELELFADHHRRVNDGRSTVHESGRDAR